MLCFMFNIVVYFLVKFSIEKFLMGFDLEWDVLESDKLKFDRAIHLKMLISSNLYAYLSQSESFDHLKFLFYAILDA